MIPLWQTSRSAKRAANSNDSDNTIFFSLSGRRPLSGRRFLYVGFAIKLRRFAVKESAKINEYIKSKIKQLLRNSGHCARICVLI